VVFNTAESLFRDVSKEIADEFLQRYAAEGGKISATISLNQSWLSNQISDAGLLETGIRDVGRSYAAQIIELGTWGPIPDIGCLPLAQFCRRSI